jgi:putative protease
MSLSYTRGFGDGFFAGSDHQTLVEGRFPKHRGVYLGRVTRVSGSQVTIRTGDDQGRPWTGALAAGDRSGPVGDTRVRLPLAGAPAPVAIRPGMGVVFDSGHPEDKSEPGGPVFHVDERNGQTVLGFGNVGPDLSRVAPGDRVWITQDPAITRATEKLVAAPEPEGRVALDLVITGTDGAPLSVSARAGRLSAVASSASALSPSKGGGIDEALLRDKLGGLGGTPFRIGSIDVSGLAKGLHLPVSELKAIRRALVAELTVALEAPPPRTLREGSAIDAVRDAIGIVAPRTAAPRLVPLCRSDEQLDAAIAAGVPEVELDWMEMVGLSRAVARAKDAGLAVSVATMRIEKPGEEALTDRLVKLAPDAILVRHWGALARLSALDEHPILHGDFSLNATSSITTSWLISRGLETITAAFDLDEAQSLALVDATARGRVAFVIHHRIPTFHTEHCVYSHLLSQGRDYRSCGRPCETHQVDLKDHLGNAHPVIVDAGCRNTVFNSEAQSGAGLVSRLLARGVSRFRIDLVRESEAETRRLLEAYGSLVRGEKSAEDVVKALAVRSRIGVTGRRMALLGETAE